MGLDINLQTSKIDISEEDGINVDLYTDKLDIEESKAEDIIIEITGLKSINKFIGLEDTPLYYENGKFFKVQDNKIIYTDIEWKDISGDIQDAPELIDIVKDTVEQISQQLIDNAINTHDNNSNAHQYIQSIINNNYEVLDDKIDSVQSDLFNDIEEVNNNLNQEIQDRIDGDNALGLRIDDVSEDIQLEVTTRAENDTLLQNNIDNLSDDLDAEISARETADLTLTNNLNQEIQNRINGDNSLDSKINSVQGGLADSITALDTKYDTITGALDSKIDSVEGALSDSITAIDTKYTSITGALDSKIDSVQGALSDSITALDSTVSANYNTLDDKIDSVNGTLSDSITALDTKYDTITGALNDKIDSVEGALNTHISNKSNPHEVTKTQIGLGNVDNTSDLNKPISTATQNALDGKVPNTRTVNGKPLSSDISLDYTDVNALPDTTTINDLTSTNQQNAINSGITSSLTQQISTNQTDISNLTTIVSGNYTTLNNRITSEVGTLNTSISTEVTARQNADNNLQSQIDAITSASDVTDIVGTYAELQAYDTTSLPDKSIIKVLQDESRNDETTYYRWVITNGTGAWNLIGEEGPYYTKSEADGTFVPQTLTINSKPLNNNITLTASDVGALPSNTVIGSGILTIQKNSSTIDTFSANATSNKTINISVPVDTGDLTNNAGYIKGITSSDVTSALGYTPYNSSNPSGYISGITSSDVTTALGYTPYNSSNPNNYITSADLPTNHVTTDTAQDITGVKTFVGQKMIAFKQATSSNKLGFTLYNNSGTEKGYLEFNPTNTIDGAPLMTLGNYASSSAGITHVGFRKYSSVSGASGAYNLLAPLISDARTPFNLTTTYTNFYLPLGFTDGTNTVLAAKTGLVDISSLLPTIPTVGNGTITINQGGVQKGTFTVNQTGNTTINLDAGGSIITNPLSISKEDSGITYTYTTGFNANNRYYTQISVDDGTTTTNTQIPSSYNISNSGGLNISTSTNSSGSLETTKTFSIGVNVDDNTIKINSNGKLYFNNSAGYITGITSSDITTALGYTPQNTLVSGTNIKTINSTSVLGSGNISVADTTLSNVSSINSNSAVKTALDAKQNTISGGASTITSSNLTASRALISNSSGKVAVSDVTSTELGYLDGVTSAIQTQLDSKQGTSTAVTHTANTEVGGTTTPVYIASDGKATALSYTIAKSVPSNAVFTDTTYANGTGITIGTGNAINHSNSVTAGTAGTSSATSGSTLSVPYVTYDAQGHVTASGTHTHTVTGFSTTDTKTTACSYNSTSKLFLIGATSQSSATTDAQAKTTYSNSSVYTQSGYLYATTPASTTNDTTVATTKFVKDQGYTSNTGTVTSVNNISPVSGNVTLSIPTVTDTYSSTSSNAMSGKAVASALSNSGFITGITSSDVTTALGYTPYNSTNPNGYITSSALTGYLQNTATGTSSLTILGTASANTGATNVGLETVANANYGSAFGYKAKASASSSTAIGRVTTASGSYSVAIGYGATCSGGKSIQLGYGTNSTATSLFVGFQGVDNYQLLDGTTGLIPDARISSNIMKKTEVWYDSTSSTLYIGVAQS